MRRTGVKKYSSKLITNGKCTFGHVLCGLGFLVGEREDLPCCLGPLLSMVPLATPTLIVLPSGLLLGSALAAGHDAATVVAGLLGQPDG